MLSPFIVIVEYAFSCLATIVPKCALTRSMDLNGAGNLALWSSQDNNSNQIFMIKEIVLNSNILGDADGDGRVSILDATIIQRYIAEYSVKNPDIVVTCGDVNKNSLDILDATLIQRFLADYYVPYQIGEPIT